MKDAIEWHNGKCVNKRVLCGILGAKSQHICVCCFSFDKTFKNLSLTSP